MRNLSFDTGEKIYITGHDNPDFDSVASAYLCNKYFSFKGILSEIIFFSYPDENAALVLEKIGIDFEKFLSEEKFTENLFLVDCSESIHGKIIGAVDHHPTTKVFDYGYYYNEPSSSCALTIFNMMRKENYPLSKQDWLIALYSVYMDTLSMQSSKYNEKDGKFVEEAFRITGADRKELFKAGLCLTDFSRGIEKAALTNLKKYHFGNLSVCSTSVKTEEADEKTVSQMLDFLNDEKTAQKADLWVFIVIELTKNSTTVYKLYHGKKETQIFNTLRSRAKEIMPEIENEYKKYLQ